MRSNIVGSRRRVTTFLALGAVTALALSACSSSPASDNGDSDTGSSITALNVIAPADAGGGWDQTARALAQVITQDKILGSAPVTNIGGAGGTVGLAKLATEKDPATLMITGSVMVGAVETNASSVRVEDMTPIAKLTEEALVVVVPKGSTYTDVDSLLDAVVEKGPAISITGGSAGGTDHILAAMMVTEAGVKASDVATKLNYIPNSGGGEAVTMLLGNTVTAGVSGAGEFIEQIKSGDLVALAVSGAERLEALPEVPTLTEEGIDVTLTNWRGVIAPGGLTDEQKQALVDVVTTIHESATWTKMLSDKGWADAFMTGDEFDSFLTEDIALTQDTLKAIGLIE